MNRYKIDNILEISKICIGADHFGTAIDKDTASRILDMYVDHGGNFIDTANVYGKWVAGAGNASEKFLGEWQKSRKKEVIIATKGGHYDLSAPPVMRLKEADLRLDLEESLSALNKECIDFYWLHRDDISMHIGEILDTLETFKKEGKIRFYGASNFCGERLWQAKEYAVEHNITGFSAVSNQHSAATVNRGANTNPDPTLVIHGESEEDFHIKTKTPLIPYQSTARGYFSKIAGGVVSDSLKKAYDNEKTRATYKEVCDLAAKENCSVQTASILYLAKSPYPVLPITSVRKIEQLTDIFDAMEKI